MPLAIVIYIDGRFIKHSIPVKPIYITVLNLDSSVSGKAMAWLVLGMLPGFKKSETFPCKCLCVVGISPHIPLFAWYIL